MLVEVIRKSSSVPGCAPESARELADRRVVAKLTSMLDLQSQPLQDALSALEKCFSDRLIHPHCVRSLQVFSFLLLSGSLTESVCTRTHHNFKLKT